MEQTQPSNRLTKFCKGIETMEGYYPFTRAYLNKNPGNLRESSLQIGMKGGFAVFPNYEVGFKALVNDVTKKCTGKSRTGLTGESTILDFCKIYAPKEDNNNPVNYAKFVSAYCGLTINTKLKELLVDPQPEVKPEVVVIDQPIEEAKKITLLQTIVDLYKQIINFLKNKNGQK